MESKLVGQFSGGHCIWEILLVGEDEKSGIPEFILVEHLVQLLTRLFDTFFVVGIDDKDESLRVLEVMPPEWTDLVLTSDVPDSE